MARIQFGTYRPAYWRINITAPVDLSNLKALEPKDLALYIHEYTHFLQEITSTSGLNYSWNILDRFRQVLIVVQQGGPDILVPLRGPVVEEQLKFKRSLAPVIGGYVVEHDDGTYVVRNVSLPPSRLIEEITGHKIPEVHLALENREGRKREYIFGSDAIQETMAQLMEEKINDEHTTEQFPYIAAQRLADYMCPIVASNKEFLFAACDVALMSPYPGWHFYQLLLTIGQKEFKPVTAEEIYEFAFELFERDGWRVFESYGRAVDSLSHIVDLLFGEQPEYQPTKLWFIHVIQTALRLRRDNRYLMLELYRDNVFGPSWDSIVAKVGLPEVMNGEQQRWVSPPLELRHLAGQIEPIHLWAIWQINDLLLEGRAKATCRIVDACNATTSRYIVTEICRSAPWEKANMNPLCPYGALWRYWGLCQKTLVFE